MKKVIFWVGMVLACGVSGGAFAQQFPNVSCEDQNGNRVETASLVDGKTPFVVSFWSTTCKPCIKELDALSEQMADWLEEVSFRVVAVSVDDSRSVTRARALADGRGWGEFTLLYDQNSDFKRALNVNYTPHVFVFDRDGRQVYSHTGYLPGGEAELLEAIRKLNR